MMNIAIFADAATATNGMQNIPQIVDKMPKTKLAIPDAFFFVRRSEFLFESLCGTVFSAYCG